jgi:hypothetical protein
MIRKYVLNLLKIKLAICKLPPDSPIPDWVISKIVCNNQVTSILSSAMMFRASGIMKSGWRAFYLTQI